METSLPLMVFCAKKKSIRGMTWHLKFNKFSYLQRNGKCVVIGADSEQLLLKPKFRVSSPKVYERKSTIYVTVEFLELPFLIGASS